MFHLKYIGSRCSILVKESVTEDYVCTSWLLIDGVGVFVFSGIYEGGIGMISSDGFKKLAVVFLLIILSSVLWGCGMEKGRVYDSDNEIAKEGDSYTFVSRVGNESKKRIDISFRKFAGVETLWLIEAKEDGVIELKFDTEITKGDFKLVIVTPEQEVINVAEQTNKGSYKMTTLKGKYRVKIVGRTATGEFEMDLETRGMKRVSHPSSDW